MWILLWLVLSSILIGASVWSFIILQHQKKAWEKYAKDKKFAFNRGTFMGPAEMNGVIGDYKLSFFTAERQGIDVRTRRYVTVVEIDLVEGLVDGGVMGTKEMLPFMQSLDKLHPYKINIAGWEEGHYAFVKDENVAEAFLTADRLETFMQILKTRNADSIVIFNDHEVVVRLETSDPMQNADNIDKIVKRITGLCDKLRLTADERARITALAKA